MADVRVDPSRCVIWRCGRTPRAHGYCSTDLWRAQQDPEFQPQPYACKTENCDGSTKRRNKWGLCKKCYKRKYMADNREAIRAYDREWQKRKRAGQGGRI